ncbi:TPA: SpaH/EbpB family LPXTG-anchored major pilin [Streptococcus suis]|uniref:SpaH/EbpB family LPXTG-anchored major pilin n=1 Tax=Streptococcus suis TaxID=1307 RepID=UPI000CF3EE10|nr:SpaH/EbpB family LPXTG-anchored major pilin [Streptococcus suis]MCK3895707.1 SpaH/EbpB family LPXTG-anchored major pilin [Streptococcus suis]NQM50976.1 SpaH/EbpB family LPXTG-anchored major pilin [Streptococcus suis]QTA56006.1 SpaH/EbpB family LPXTG-anchored major pilin [Streptococcus suis]HEL1703233.1 SpaH/EbpB family LPXTG-anchored major pilin [Streptococcus suis]
MKKLTKVFSLLTVLLTMFGPLGNLRHLVHANTTQQTKVVVHKILLNKEQFEAFNHEAKKDQYNGTQIAQITDFFGSSATEIEGVNFKVWQKVEQTGDGTKTGAQLGITGEGADEHYKLFVDSNDKMYGSRGVNTGSGTTGAEFILENGTYIFVEDKANSPYYNKQEGNELTEAKAVPFRLVLPVTRPDGTGYFDSTNNPLHVYPKNTEDKPTVKKTFGNDKTDTQNVEIGEEIDYKITTKIPKGSSYKTIVWEDLMVEGLDFVQGSLTVASKEVAGLEKGTHYTVTDDKRGFMMKMQETGLTAIEEAAKTKDVNITLTYKAVLNDSAKVDTEIPNTVKFHYGNRPRNLTDEEPKPVTPKEDGGQLKIKINKVWGGTGGNVNNKNVTFVVYEKETGKKIGEATIQAGQTTVDFTHQDLKSTKEYIVVEKQVNGYIPTYTTTNDAGTITVTNNPSDNPPPIVPDQPKVITHGKRFIKTDDKAANAGDIQKLTGAEFAVKNGEGKYLALKSADTQAEALTKYTQAEQTYLTALKNGTADTEKAARDAAYEALNMQWEWVTEVSKAFKFISSADGKFEVKGLRAGSYELVETKAPDGYALPSSTIPFVVNQGSWTDSAQETAIDGHTQVKNKKITIPQTGGIGTLIFTVVGLSTMVFAFIAMKKRQAEEA